jgi:magnesium transporter
MQVMTHDGADQIPFDMADELTNGALEAVTAWLVEAGPLEIADELTRLRPLDKAIGFRLLPRDRALEVFEMLDPSDQQEILDDLHDENVLALVEEMDPDDRVRLFGELPAMVAARLLARLSPGEMASTALLLGYPERSAGRMMSPDYVSLRASMTAAEALVKIRREAPDAETIYALPVLDDERHLIGVTGLRSVLVAGDDQLVAEVMTTDNIHKVSTDTDREVAARLVQDAGLLALPVVDSEDRLVGVITVDDAMTVIEEEATEDFARAGAASPLGKSYLAASSLGLARARAVWLMVLIGAAALTVNVLQFFEETLSAVVALALFIPLLGGTGGNSGAQASTAVIRALAVGEVRISDLPRVVWRETRTGVALGAMLGAAAFVPVAVLYGADLAVVVSATLLAICAWATAVGSALPLLARKVGVDPAVVSAPLVTTLVDATGLIIYFVIARAVLGL